ncbi:MAG: methyl-accepting chemotaxis protein [Alphaproteobacteria bacterium]|nr:methyl-accepting chemotaxis protein [Alphaproteobacteria bacterium]
MAHRTRDAGVDQAETELGSLINVSGKLRMLSHRAVMFALLDAISEGGDDEARSRFDATIDEFSSIVALITEDSDGEPLAPAVAVALGEAKALTDDHKRCLARFLNDAKRARLAPISDRGQQTVLLSTFAAFVATDLLEALNQINEGIGRALNAVIAARKDRESAIRHVIGESISQIEEVSFAVKLIALNASIEAARAGEYGRGFGVIAEEIKQLSEKTTHSVKDVRKEFAGLA